MDNFEYTNGATPIDPDEMEGLKIGHITTREELNRFEQDNINEALQWLQSRRKSDILTEKFAKTLHQKMFGKVWKWAGTFRKSGKNIGVDWHKISTELHVILHDVRYWIDQKTYPDAEIAVRFHHRLVWVHPFANGNGRIFVHAGINLKLNMAQQDKEFLVWDRNLMNEAYIKHQLDPLYRFGPYREIFIGHTPTQVFHSLKPMHMCNLWAMDTGAGWTGKLTIMDVDSKKFWQSDLATDLYKENGRQAKFSKV